ncbi:AbrB/MazE/SpoVT family DNA-binding domain-containing protein [Grimontia hollisae]|uniref:hypothetical protein n=1 Tax=Grimontia hollisae TaxID=673 RepID=UPI00165E719A|nr:hypothetical protein [Grimontia hollisae]
MSKKKYSEKELLEGLSSYTAHSDELAKINKKDWDSYFESVEKADEDFLVDRSDVIEESAPNLFDEKDNAKDD